MAEDDLKSLVPGDISVGTEGDAVEGLATSAVQGAVMTAVVVARWLPPHRAADPQRPESSGRRPPRAQAHQRRLLENDARKLGPDA